MVWRPSLNSILQHRVTFVAPVYLSQVLDNTKLRQTAACLWNETGLKINFISLRFPHFSLFIFLSMYPCLSSLVFLSTPLLSFWQRRWWIVCSVPWIMELRLDRINCVHLQTSKNISTLNSEWFHLTVLFVRLSPVGFNWFTLLNLNLLYTCLLYTSRCV